MTESILQLDPNLSVPYDGLQKVFKGAERMDLEYATVHLPNILQAPEEGIDPHLAAYPSLTLPKLQAVTLYEVQTGLNPIRTDEARPIMDTLKKIYRTFTTYPWLASLALQEIGEEGLTVGPTSVVGMAKNRVFSRFYLPQGISYREASNIEAYSRVGTHLLDKATEAAVALRPAAENAVLTPIRALRTIPSSETVPAYQRNEVTGNKITRLLFHRKTVNTTAH